MDKEYENFKAGGRQEIAAMGRDEGLRAASLAWLVEANKRRYSYHFEWLGRPIIQYPQDIVATQELIWAVKPDLIIETGVAHGGSVLLSASMLAMLDYCEAVEAGRVLDPRASRRRVVGVDIDIRAHNRAAIEAHPLAHHIRLIQGSSIAPDVVAQVHEVARAHRRVLVCLDSNHTHDHVLAELEAYAGLTSQGSYCCVFDSVIEDLPADMFPDRPWGKGNNPKTALHEFLRRQVAQPGVGADGAALKFEIDHGLHDKLMVTVAPDGYLRRLPA